MFTHYKDGNIFFLRQSADWFGLKGGVCACACEFVCFQGVAVYPATKRVMKRL